MYRAMVAILRGAAVFSAVTAIAAVASGCTAVAPYERGKLAHPTMTIVDLASSGAMHLREINEGAAGGSAGVGSGCGCN